MITSRQCLRFPETAISFSMCPCLFPVLEKTYCVQGVGGSSPVSWNCKGNLLTLRLGRCLLCCTNLHTVNTHIPGKYSGSFKYLSTHPACIGCTRLDWSFYAIFLRQDNNMKGRSFSGVCTSTSTWHLREFLKCKEMISPAFGKMLKAESNESLVPDELLTRKLKIWGREGTCPRSQRLQPTKD